MTLNKGYGLLFEAVSIITLQYAGMPPWTLGCRLIHSLRTYPVCQLIGLFAKKGLSVKVWVIPQH